MSARVRFSQERPGIAYVPSNQVSSNNQLLSDILSKPMPSKHADDRYYIDACTAASIGDESTIRKLFEINPSFLSRKNQCGWTPLHYAAYLGHNTVISFLLDQKSKVDDVNCRGQSALMMAAACGNINAVRLLLERGASVQIFDKENRQAIHYAASCSQNVVVDALLLAGANPNWADKNGMTSVHEAVLTGHELTLLSLLEKGGDIELRNAKDENAFHLACDNPKILQILNEHKKETAEKQNNLRKVPRSLSDLLKEMDLERYSEQFKNENIDLNVFFELKKGDFDDMKIAYGPKKRMLDVIERYRMTGIIRTDTFDNGSASSYSPNSCQSETTESSGKLSSTLKSIRDINQDTKRLAMEGLEALGGGQTDRIRTILIGIVESVEQIAVKVAPHV